MSPSVIASWGVEISNYKDPLVGLLLLIWGFVWFVIEFKPWKWFYPRQSNLLLFPPKHNYTLTWDPKHSLQIITRPSLREGEKPPDSRLPIFRLKNLGKEVLRDVKIDWEISHDLFPKSSFTAERFKNFYTSIENNLVSIGHIKEGIHEESVYPISFQETSLFEYISPQIDNDTYKEVDIPIALYHVLETLFVTEIPQQCSIGQTVSAKLQVKISYVENGKKLEISYIVTALARSTKPWCIGGSMLIPIDGKMREPPEVMADIKFTVSKT